METKKLLGFVVAILAAFMAVSFVSAGTLGASINEVSVNDASSLDSPVLSVSPGESVPIVVRFEANANLEDLKLKVWIDGYKSEISASTARFNVVNGSTYIKRLSLAMPSVEDLKDNLNQALTLHVRIADTNDETEQVYALSVEKDTYSYDVLNVEAPTSASAGEIIALDVVLKNVGTEELADSFVTASIPELGVARKVYFGDLQAQDNEADNLENARERMIYLTIPSDAKSGSYVLQVTPSNYDTSATVKRTLSINGLAVSNTTTIDAIGSKDKMPTSILVLTIVLVVVFVVLLVVLIVLLTRKPSEKSEDFGETSYY